MANSVFLLFTSLDGNPLNFRLLCNHSSVKCEYILKITNHGGVVQRATGSPRIILVGGSLPCERGHFECNSHPPFSKEPAFKISWVDDCLSVRELIDIKGYLLNSSPKFAQIDYMKMIHAGAYKPPLPRNIPESSANNYTKIDEILSNGGLNLRRESHQIIATACKRALGRTVTSVELSPSTKGLRQQSSTSSASCNSVADVPSLIYQTSHDPLNILRNSQASSTPLQKLPVASKKTKRFVRGRKGAISSSSSEGETENSPTELPKSSAVEKRNPTRPLAESLQPPKLFTASCSSKGITGPSQSTSSRQNEPKERGNPTRPPAVSPPKIFTAACSSKGIIGPSQSTSSQQNEPKERGNSTRSNVAVPLSSNLCVASCSSQGKTGTTPSSLFQQNVPSGKDCPRVPVTLSSSSSSDSDSPPKAKAPKLTAPKPIGPKPTTVKQSNQPKQESSASDHKNPTCSNVAVPLSKLCVASCSSQGKTGTTPSSLFQQNVPSERDCPRVPVTFSSRSSSDSDSPPKAKAPKPTAPKPTEPKPTTVKQSSHTKQDSSDSDDNFWPHSNANVRVKSVRQNTKEPYTRNEEFVILKYILASKKLSGIKSNVLWKALDNKPGLEKRTWQSLKNHFLKFMLPNLEIYSSILTPELIQKLRRTETYFSKNKYSHESGSKI